MLLPLFPEIRKIEIEKLEFKYDKKEFSEDIPFKISNELYKIMVFDKNLNQPINFECMSDGSKRIFLQLATIIIAIGGGFSVVQAQTQEVDRTVKEDTIWVDYKTRYTSSFCVSSLSLSCFNSKYGNTSPNI